MDVRKVAATLIWLYNSSVTQCVRAAETPNKRKNVCLVSITDLQAELAAALPETSVLPPQRGRRSAASSCRLRTCGSWPAVCKLLRLSLGRLTSFQAGKAAYVDTISVFIVCINLSSVLLPSAQLLTNLGWLMPLHLRVCVRACVLQRSKDCSVKSEHVVWRCFLLSSSPSPQWLSALIIFDNEAPES